MGKQEKQYKSAQREMNDYQKNRLSRIQENQDRLRDLGVKSIENSLTSLVESQNPKKKKVKTKYTSASGSARDSDYNSGLGDDGDRDYQEVATNAEVSKKKHISQYIAPNRLANLSKQRRVVAPNVSNKFPLDSNSTKEKQARTNGLKDDLNEGGIVRSEDAAQTWVLQTIGHSYKKRCLRAKEIRMSLKNIHTAGPKSFARIRDEMKNEDPNHEFPTLTQMFERTRKRTDERVYVDTYDDTARKLEKMKNYKPLEDESDVVDPYMVVMNKENDGYRRLYGRGVTNIWIKKAELEAMQIDINNQREKFEEMIRVFREKQALEGRSF
ncbi:hypothetical protein LXL04_033953 [Taraxacum kok-saghyz]